MCTRRFWSSYSEEKAFLQDRSLSTLSKLILPTTNNIYEECYLKSYAIHNPIHF